MSCTCSSCGCKSEYFFVVRIATGFNWIGVGSITVIISMWLETLKMTVPDTSSVEIIVGVSSEMLIDASHVHLQRW